jgi:hypothetical protein
MKQVLQTMCLVLLISALSIPVASQSLGDVARKQQANPSKKAKIVVTEDDIPASPQSALDTTSPTDAGDTSGDSPSQKQAQSRSPQISKGPTTENVAALKARVNELASKQQEYETSIAQLEQKLQNAPSDFRAETYKGALENNRHSLKVITQQRESTERQLAEMQQKMKSSEGNASTN